jgi:hypothetical protein
MSAIHAGAQRLPASHFSGHIEATDHLTLFKSGSRGVGDRLPADIRFPAKVDVLSHCMASKTTAGGAMT